MKRTYADLHLCPNPKDTAQTSNMINKAAKLGFRLIAIPLLPNASEKEIEGLRAVCDEAKVDLATRLDLKPRSPNELIDCLRKFRRRYEIIAVVCESKKVARQAAKDRRVDLLSFPSIDFHYRHFDLAEAELASTALASVEIDMKPLLTLEGRGRTRFLSSLRKEAAIAQAFHVPVVLSSGVSNESLMRKPQELVALSSLFDLDKTVALEAISKNSVALVKRNREKLDPRYVVPGIRIVRRGKDC